MAIEAAIATPIWDVNQRSSVEAALCDALKEIRQDFPEQVEMQSYKRLTEIVERGR